MEVTARTVAVDGLLGAIFGAIGTRLSVGSSRVSAGATTADEVVPVPVGPQRGPDGRFVSSGVGPSRYSRASEYPSGYRSGVVDQVLDANTIRSGPNAGMVRTLDGEIVARNDPRLTIEHIRPVVDHWNEIGYNVTKAVRNDFFNDVSNMSIRLRSANSADGGHMAANGVRYRQDVGPDYSR